MNQQKKQNLIEYVFENFLWNARLGTVIVVVFSLLGAFVMFILGAREIWHATVLAFQQSGHAASMEKVLINVVGAVDLFLIGVVLMLFSYGIYELFVSKIDPAKGNAELDILKIESIDELKNKVLKVIVMVLIVSFFKSVLSAKFTTPLELVYFAVAIFAVAGSAALLRKSE